jgi:alkanesulfonate monooxygenase SsuD/methylene tetrahydromethanopterin reductase-like flavin-dependent oxidoreductase (luciferase family)
MISLSFIAAATERIKIGTSLLVLPYLEPVNTAMQISALDQFSGGRLIVGIGSGAYREEFEALHPNLSPRKRGLIMEESTEALIKLISEEKAEYYGEYIRFKEIEMNVKPIQKPLPLWIGGNASIVQKRAGLYGEGWFPAALSIAEIKKGVERVKKHARIAGRPPDKIEIAPQYLGFIGRKREDALKKYKESLGYTHTRSLKKSTLRDTASMMMNDDLALIERNFIGSPDDIIKQVERYSEAGATYFPAIAFSHEEKQLESVVDQWKLFSKEIIPSF